MLSSVPRKLLTRPVVQSWRCLTSAAIPKGKYGGRQTVTVMPGDGIGPEMMAYMREVLEHVHAPVDLEILDAINDNDKIHNAIQSVRRNGVAIKGNIETSTNRIDIKSSNVEMRNQLDLFANVVHCRSQPVPVSWFGGMELVMGLLFPG